MDGYGIPEIEADIAAMDSDDTWTRIDARFRLAAAVPDLLAHIAVQADAHQRYRDTVQARQVNA
jgi:hypothetical protein